MNMMDLKGYSPEMLDKLKEFFLSKQNYAAIRYIEEFRETYGYQVRVVRGRKVAHGTIGRCFWMGTRNYSKGPDYWGIKTVTRIGLRDDAGQVYWTSLDNVEVIAGTYDAPVKPVKKYNRVYHALTEKPLYGMEESSKLRELHKKLEAASDKYNVLRNRTDELMDKEQELKKAGKADEELSRKIDEACDADEAAKKELKKLEREYHHTWMAEIGSKVR